ncbi:hypothetical protein TOPH_03447 [Tolypocladium ophioglossoides CBS 100239]|uniref:Methyltransferase type 11 domain-containing protein n=1 Tax=Tolypocladium ophioglossoides (strain CBS 100239) TaxID=1163406 RepID=A0A0L0NCW1_TOLOC|nr:hypothetical protein TOPH_03447 [Tolypocladium ophioglossoides CBS 100239]
MASLRTGYGLPARPSDGYRPRRPEESGSRAGIPRSVNRPAAWEAEITQTANPESPSQPRPSTRVPQQPSVRRTGLPRPSSRLISDSQPRSWGSASRTSSGDSKSHTQSGSYSSSSGRSCDDGLRLVQTSMRGKKSSVSHNAANSRNDSVSTNSSSPRRQSQGSLEPGLGIQYDRDMTQSPAPIQTAEMVQKRQSAARPPIIYPELDRYRDFQRPEQSSNRPNLDVPYPLATHDLPPPTPASILFSGSSSQVSAITGSPSTRFSESPGLGAYSRDTTPTSMSSQSPVFVAPSRVNAPTRARQISPALTRPPVTRRRAGSIPNTMDAISADPIGLAAVRESTTSSSSSSTVRDGDKNAKRDKRANRRLPPPPPSPPPRKSSQKFQKNKDEEEPPSKTSREVKKSSQTARSLPKPSVSSQTQSPSPPKSGPPSRPSRDGTPDMQSQLFDPIPIIQSNLLWASRSPERRGSEPVATRSLPGSTASLSQTKKNASTSHLPVGQEMSSTMGAAADATKPSSPGISRPSLKASPKVGPSFNTRFPFFGRRKAASESLKADKVESKKKLTRKGPVAGTGHEGYGKIGAVRRRSGSGSNLSRGLPESQSSQDSLGSSDSFLADRVNPVIIAGGEVVENRNASTELSLVDSSQSIPYGRPSTESKASSGSSPTSRNASRTTLWPSALPHGPHGSPNSRRPSDSSSTDGVPIESTLAFRRSVQRLRSSPDNPLRLPQPIITHGRAPSSSPMTSFDTSILSDESHIELQQEMSRGSNDSHPAPKKLQKRARSPRKWNLFSRSQSRSNTEEKSEKVQATVIVVDKKPIAFYAMMDSTEQDGSEPMDIREILRNADVYSPLPKPISTLENRTTEFRSPERPRAVASPRIYPQQPAVREVPNVPTPPTARPEDNTIPSTASSSGRPSRLQQVGRIPQVVKHRHENVSPHSFSRPFCALHLPPKVTTNAYDPESIAKGPTPPKPSTPVPDLTLEGPPADSGINCTSDQDSIAKLSPEVIRGEREFLALSPRKNSDGTIKTSSSSSGGIHAFAGATAVIPKPDDPLAEDEVWDEYNDLLGDDNAKAPRSATSSKGVPFHLETYHTRLSKEKSIESLIIAANNRKTSTPSEAPTHSTSYSADMTERIRTAFQPHPSPSAPFSVSDVVPSYGKRNNSDDVENAKDPAAKRSSSSSGKTIFSDCSTTTSDDGSPLAQVNLRVGSMTVSKWLTFGHVLFSDIRHELVPVESSLKRHSILVIDGLGNDDWSFYAAETYPAASFYNLSPRAPLPAEAQGSPTGFPLSPPNHHQVQYLSHLDKFPFAPQSFDCMVYRFPIAAPESHYRNIVSEARRVLRPGAYIELSILDVDLNNMGNRGRRTVRGLKEKINDQTADTCLASTADLIVRLMGKAGFSSIKAARVGVPVASSITRSDNNKAVRKNTIGKKKEPPSLADMMSDNSPMADESITKIVTRVGRWWYTRCYESAAGAANKSLWADKTLVSDCTISTPISSGTLKRDGFSRITDGNTGHRFPFKNERYKARAYSRADVLGHRQAQQSPALGLFFIYPNLVSPADGGFLYFAYYKAMGSRLMLKQAWHPTRVPQLGDAAPPCSLVPPPVVTRQFFNSTSAMCIRTLCVCPRWKRCPVGKDDDETDSRTVRQEEETHPVPAMREETHQGGYPCEYCVRTKKTCQQQEHAQPAIKFITFTQCPTAQLPTPMGRPSDIVYLDHFASFIRRCQFTREFASGSTDLLPLIHASPSLRDLAVAIGALDASRRGSVSSFSPRESPQCIAFRFHGRSLRALRARLATADAAHGEDVLWSTFLLGLFELISETSGDGWAKHMLYGTSKMLQLAGPAEQLSSLRRQLFGAFRLLEASRAILYGEDTFLSQDKWLHFQTGYAVAGNSFPDPMESILTLIIQISSFNKRFFATIESVPESLRPIDLSIDALAHEGMELQRTIFSWQDEVVPYLDLTDAYAQLALTYYHSLELFLARNYTYYSCWHGKTIPSLTHDEIDAHTAAIIDLSQNIIRASEIPGVTLMFPLRMSGAHAAGAQQRSRVLGILGQVYQKGFVVSNRMTVDVRELWEYQELQSGELRVVAAGGESEQ